MPDTTPVYALRFQEVGDAPNGPALGEDLATDVEAEIIRLDALIAALTARPLMGQALCTTQLDLTTSDVDVPGATVTIVTTKPNAKYRVDGSFYMSAVTGGTGVATGKLAIDGVNQTANANWTGVDTVARGTPAQAWQGTLAAAGSHVFKLRASQSAVGGGNGAFRVNTTGTAIAVMVFE